MVQPKIKKRDPTAPISSTVWSDSDRNSNIPEELLSRTILALANLI